MNYLVLIIPLLIIACLLTIYFGGFISVNRIHGKLWSDIEHQLEQLTKKHEVQEAKITGLKELLRKEGINFTHNPLLNDEDNNDPYAYDIISNIKEDFELLKYYYTRGITVNDPKYEHLQTTNQSFADIRPYEYLSTNYSVALSEHCTLGGADYEFINITGSTEFRFKLRAPSSGYIALANIPWEMLPTYDIILGDNSNTKSIIRKNNFEVAKISHGKLLKGCEFMSFWIRWSDGVIRVGFESDIKPFLQYNATDLYKVNYIGLKTYDKVGNWIIY